MNEYKQIINDFFAFIRKPEDKINDNQTISHKLKVLGVLLLLEIPVMVALTLIIALIELTGLVDTSAHKINRMLFDYPLFVVFLTAVIFLPFVEEFIFRLYLRFRHNIPIQTALAINSFFNKESNLKSRVKLSWDRYYFQIFYISALIFGYIHIINYETDIYVWIFSPLLILPQFVIGVFLGYARVRYSLMLGFLLHALHNMIFLGVAIISMNFGEVLLDKDTDDFFLKIEENSFAKDMNYYATGNMDTLETEGIELIRILADINNSDIHQFSSNDDSKSDKKLNIKYHSKNGNINHTDTLTAYLQDVFEFNLKESKENVTAYNIMIDDRFILSEYISNTDKSKPSTSTDKKDTIFIDNMNLLSIANSLSGYTGYNFIYNGTDTAKYNMELHNGNELIIIRELEYEYGLKVIDTTINVNKYLLEFN